MQIHMEYRLHIIISHAESLVHIKVVFIFMLFFRPSRFRKKKQREVKDCTKTDNKFHNNSTWTTQFLTHFVQIWCYNDAVNAIFTTYSFYSFLRCSASFVYRVCNKIITVFEQKPWATPYAIKELNSEIFWSLSWATSPGSGGLSMLLIGHRFLFLIHYQSSPSTWLLSKNYFVSLCNNDLWTSMKRVPNTKNELV